MSWSVPICRDFLFPKRERLFNHNTRIRTRLKWHINGAFRLVVAHRRQPHELLRTEIPSLLRSFQVEEFCRKKNLHRQGKNAVNPVGLTSILTQYVRIFLRQNRVRMRVLWLCSFALITRRRQPYGQSHASLPKKFDGRNSPTLKPKNFAFLKSKNVSLLTYFK